MSKRLFILLALATSDVTRSIAHSLVIGRKSTDSRCAVNLSGRRSGVESADWKEELESESSHLTPTPASEHEATRDRLRSRGFGKHLLRGRSR